MEDRSVAFVNSRHSIAQLLDAPIISYRGDDDHVPIGRDLERRIGSNLSCLEYGTFDYNSVAVARSSEMFGHSTNIVAKQYVRLSIPSLDSPGGNGDSCHEWPGGSGG